MTEFKPYLIIGTENYGIIGTDAEFTDSIGISLKVGDTVMLYDNGKKWENDQFAIQKNMVVL